MIPMQERLEGGLVGLLVGDALGVPYEFHPPENLPPLQQIEYLPPRDFRRSHPDISPGTWSDDGAQALCLLASLLEQGRLDVDDLACRLVSWAREGTLAVDGRVFDIGTQTATALARLERGGDPRTSGPAGERDNGNGSLMRVLPLALWHQGGDGALVKDAHLQSLPTHGHPRAQVCCAMYCLWARALLLAHPHPWTHAAQTLKAIYATGAGDPMLYTELMTEVLPWFLPGGTGYVLDTLHSARLVLNRDDDYETTVRAAVALGYDTDTTACVAGGLAGVRGGIRDIPSRWRAGLRGQELLAPLLDGLVTSI